MTPILYVECAAALVVVAAMLASQVWMILRVRKQDRLVADLGRKSLPDAVHVLIEQRYGEMLAECVGRQPGHEREHQEAHGSGAHFTSGLRIENVARRLARKIAAAGLPALSIDELRRRAKEALWPQE